MSEMNHKLIVNMREINHTMRSLYEGKASQKRILIILQEEGQITQRDLTARLGIQPGSVSEILSKLEHAGFLQRTASEKDRRTANISLTKKGEQMAQEAAQQRRQRHEEMFSCLSETEKEELLFLLEKINADWNCRYKAAGKCGTMHHRQAEGCRSEHQWENQHGYGHRHGERSRETEDTTTWESM